MKRQNKAIVLFSRIPQINRSNRDEPFAALPWDDLDTLFTAMLGDVTESCCLVEDADVFLYRDGAEFSDDLLSRFRPRITICDLPSGSFAEQVQQAVESVFLQHYDRVIVILDNHPLFSTKFLMSVFHQLEYEDNCIVLGPTAEGKCFFLALKSDIHILFNVDEGDPLSNFNLLMNRMCRSNALLFPTPTGYSLDSGFNLARLKNDIEALAATEEKFPHRTHEMFKMFDKKYKSKKSAR